MTYLTDYSVLKIVLFSILHSLLKAPKDFYASANFQSVFEKLCLLF